MLFIVVDDMKSLLDCYGVVIPAHPTLKSWQPRAGYLTGLMKRTAVWETLSLVRLGVLVVLAITLMVGLVKSNKATL